MQALERRIARVLVDVDDAAAALGADFAHRVEHARVVAPIGARLHEDKALNTEFACLFQVFGQRRARRLVAQVGRVRIALRRTEDVEMAVAVHSRMQGTLALLQTSRSLAINESGMGMPASSRVFRVAASGSPGTSTGCDGSSGGVSCSTSITASRSSSNAPSGRNAFGSMARKKCPRRSGSEDF